MNDKVTIRKSAPAKKRKRKKKKKKIERESNTYNSLNKRTQIEKPEEA